jgi:hypothetical protein
LVVQRCAAVTTASFYTSVPYPPPPLFPLPFHKPPLLSHFGSTKVWRATRAARRRFQKTTRKLQARYVLTIRFSMIFFAPQPHLSARGRCHPLNPPPSPHAYPPPLVRARGERCRLCLLQLALARARPTASQNLFSFCSSRSVHLSFCMHAHETKTRARCVLLLSLFRAQSPFPPSACIRPHHL